MSQKREKFRELAEARTTKALDAIARIGNLSNRQVYEYEDTEVKKSPVLCVMQWPKSKHGSKSREPANQASNSRIHNEIS